MKYLTTLIINVCFLLSCLGCDVQNSCDQTNIVESSVVAKTIKECRSGDDYPKCENINITKGNMVFFDQLDNSGIKAIGLLYKADLINDDLGLINKYSDDYPFITAALYSNKHQKLFLGVMEDRPSPTKDIKSYILVINEGLEVEATISTDIAVTDFYEVGKDLYVKCNTNVGMFVNKETIEYMYKVNLENLKIEEVESNKIVVNSLNINEGKTIVIKRDFEYGSKRVTIEIVNDNNEIINKDIIEEVYPVDIQVKELENGNILFNVLDQMDGFKRNAKFYLYKKTEDDYSLIKLESINLGVGYVPTGIVEKNNNINIYLTKFGIDSENFIFSYSKDLKCLEGKYKMDLTSPIFPHQIISINGNDKMLAYHDGKYKIIEIEYK